MENYVDLDGAHEAGVFKAGLLQQLRTRRSILQQSAPFPGSNAVPV